MRQRVVGWAAVIGLVAGVIGIGLVAVATGGGGKPRPLPLQVGAAGALGERSAAALAPGADMAFPAWNVEYRVAGSLPELDDHARAYSLGRDGDVEQVAALARALGLTGKVKDEEGAWTVVDGDRQLRVERFAGLPWSYGIYVDKPECVTPDGPVASDGGVSCAVARAAVAPVAVAGGGAAGSAPAGEPTIAPCPPCPAGAECACDLPVPVTTVVEPPEPPQRPADLPTRAEAERIGRDLLAKAGLDLDGATVRVEDGFTQWFVAAQPTVDGLPTMGWEWGVGVGPKGVVEHAHGFLAEPTRGDLYPLVGVAKGIERLKTGYGMGGWSAFAARGTEIAVGPTETIPECPPDAACPAPVPPEPVVRTIENVRLGLLFSPVFGPRQQEEALLVPAYLFELDGGDVVPVVAVTDEFLPKAPEPAPVPEPSPAPHPSGEQCSGSAGGVPPNAGAEVNQPLTLEVCGPGRAKVGQEVSFTLTASDPDAVIVTGECGGPQATFGDGDTTTACQADCVPFPTDTAKEPGKHAQTFTHTYARAGTYAATFRVRSGSACDGHPWGNEGEISLEVTVVE